MALATEVQTRAVQESRYVHEIVFVVEHKIHLRKNGLEDLKDQTLHIRMAGVDAPEVGFPSDFTQTLTHVSNIGCTFRKASTNVLR